MRRPQVVARLYRHLLMIPMFLLHSQQFEVPRCLARLVARQANQGEQKDGVSAQVPQYKIQECLEIRFLVRRMVVDCLAGKQTLQEVMVLRCMVDQSALFQRVVVVVQ